MPGTARVQEQQKEAGPAAQCAGQMAANGAHARNTTTAQQGREAQAAQAGASKARLRVSKDTNKSTRAVKRPLRRTGSRQRQRGETRHTRTFFPRR